MPCSETSRPAVSTCSARRGCPRASLHRPEDAERGAEREHADGDEAEGLHAELVEAAACRRARPCRCASFAASAGTANRPVASVPQTPARPCTATAPIGSSIPIRSTQQHADDGDRRRRRSRSRCGPRRDEAARGGDRDERGDHAVQHHRDVRLARARATRRRSRRARRRPPRGWWSARRSAK